MPIKFNAWELVALENGLKLLLKEGYSDTASTQSLLRKIESIKPTVPRSARSQVPPVLLDAFDALNDRS